MKLQTLTTALREEPLPALLGEAAWRTLRVTRKAAFRISGQNSACPVRFHPIGYYQLIPEFVSADARQSILAYADAILAGKYPLIGYGKADLGPHPDWQCDWVSGKSWPLAPSASLHVVRGDGSDVKAPWELSRLQWSPLVAKAWILTGDERYRRALQSLLTDWIVNNPVGMGVNWTIAMEAALRAISLCLTMELLWPFTNAEKPWLAQLEKSLWQHLRFIEAHNEFSFLLRSNHYLSNIIGLTTLAACLQGPGMKRRLKKYARSVQHELLMQTYADGGDREASTGYHVFKAQLALHSWVVQQRTGIAAQTPFEARLRLMFAWIATLIDESFRLPLLGDCDNGRVELLLDDLVQPHALQVGGLAGLASHLLQMPAAGHQQEAVWFGCRPAPGVPEPDRKPCILLENSGIAVLRGGEAAAIFCAMPNGLSGKGSHHHCDKLSFILRLGPKISPPGQQSFDCGLPPPPCHPDRSGAEWRDLRSSTPATHLEVFCDRGTRCYTRSAEMRNLDRSTRNHNTLSVDRAEQNTISLEPQHLFRNGNEASVSRIAALEGEPAAVRASHQGYARFGIEHQRTLRLCKQSLHVEDQISGASQSRHLLELHFTLGPEWTVTSEKVRGERVSCLITGPRRLNLVCEAASPLTLHISPANISYAYGASLDASAISISTTAHLQATLRTTVRWN